MKNRMRNRKKGITLVECVVAIVLISIVTVMAFTVYGMAYSRTDDQLYEYKTKLMANNVLACFQSTETMTDFMNSFNAAFNSSLLYDEGTDISRDISVIVPGDGGGSFEFDPANMYKSTMFSKIRATEATRKIEFISGGSTVLTFSYGDQDSFDRDKTGLKDLMWDSKPVYSFKETNGDPVITYENDGITVKGSTTETMTWYEKGRNNKVTEHEYVYTYSMTYKIGKTNSSLTIKVNSTSDGKRVGTEITHSKTWSTSPIEKHYLEKGQFLYFSQDKSMSSMSSNVIYFYLYDAQSGKQTGRAVKVTYDTKSSVTNNLWYESTNQFTVSDVKEGDIKYNSFTFSDFSTAVALGGKFKWVGLPGYVKDAANKFGSKTEYSKYTTSFTVSRKSYTDSRELYKNVDSFCSITDSELSKKPVQQETPLLYTEYTPKDYIDPSLNYAKTYEGGRTDLFNSVMSEETHEGVRLGTFYGLADFGSVFPDSSENMHFKQGEGVSVDNVRFDDENKIISFRSGEQVIYSFQYENEEAYFYEKDTIATYAGLYRENYRYSETGTYFTTNASEISEYLSLTDFDSSRVTKKSMLYYYHMVTLLDWRYAYYMYSYDVVSAKEYKNGTMSREYTITYDGANAPTATEKVDASVDVIERKYIDYSSISSEYEENADSLPRTGFDYREDCRSGLLDSLRNFKNIYGTVGDTVKELIEEQCGITKSGQSSSYDSPEIHDEFESTVEAIKSRKWDNISSVEDADVLPIGNAAIRRNDETSPFKIVIKGTDETTVEDDTLIFESSASNISYMGQGVGIGDFKVIDSAPDTTEQVRSLTRYFIYAPSDSNFGLYIQVTYSTIAYDSAVEPRINIWYMKKTDLPETGGAPLNMEDVYISYRKG